MIAENTARRYLLAEDWANAYRAAISILAREERDLSEYIERPEHNAKAAAIRKQKNETFLLFVELTRDAMALQGQHIEAAAGLEYELKHLKDEHEKLKRYARSKGLQLHLLPYMSMNDFKNYGL